MRLSVIQRSENSLELKVEGLDISALYLIQEALIDDPRVKNIAVKRGHILTGESFLYILTDGSDPKDVLKNGISKASTITKSLKEDIEKALS